MAGRVVSGLPNLAERGTRIAAVGSALQSTDTRLTTVIDGVKGVLADGSWREFVTARGEHVRHDRFVDFVTTPMLKGLGATVDLIRRVVADDPEALDALDRELQNPDGNPHDGSVDNINRSERPTGTSREHALRKLRQEAEAGNGLAAELRNEVLAKRMTAHQAMVRAGFRPKTVSVPVSRPDSVAATLRKHMAPEDLRVLRDLLNEETPDA